MKIFNLVGQQFGLLTVSTRAHNTKSMEKLWLCECGCGGNIVTTTFKLNSGRVRSCGCLHKKNLFKPSVQHKKYTHGESATKLFRVWQSMKDRCHNPNCHHYAEYGQRGIQVCGEWLDSFENFKAWALASGYHENINHRGRNLCEIDRINNNGNYEPGNCRFVDRKENIYNRRTSLKIEYMGESRSLKEWAQVLGIRYNTLHNRLRNQKLPAERAFSM